MKHYKRGFLNKGEGMAAFEYHLEAEQYESNSSRRYINGSFCITDCSRKISLEFGAYDKEDRENTLYKIDTLIAELQEYRSHMIEAHKWQEEAKKDSE